MPVTAIIINAALIMLVVVGMLGLLGWGILSDRAARQRPRPAGFSQGSA